VGNGLRKRPDTRQEIGTERKPGSRIGNAENVLKNTTKIYCGTDKGKYKHDD